MIPRFIFVLFGCQGLLCAQTPEVTGSPSAQAAIIIPAPITTALAVPVAAKTEILNRLPNGTPPPPSPKLVMPNFVVKSTVIREFDVIEPPPMSGLPPVMGRITATVHLVEDPGLPDPVIPVPRVMDPARMALLRERAAKYVWPVHATVSATVYDHRRTLLKWSFFGNAKTGENPRKNYIAWSNVDFSYFGNFSSYQIARADGSVKKYELMNWVMGYNSKRERLSCTHFNKPYIAPEIPDISDIETSGPAFVIMGDHASDPNAVEFIQGLHELYRVEGARMEAAYHARKRAEDARRACFIAHPPVPENVTIHFWERDHPVGMLADTIKKGGGN